MIIKRLTPIHLIFVSPIYFFFFKVSLVVYFALYCLINGKQSLNWEGHNKINFFLDISGDIFSIIGFLIYLEVIEFSCFGFNKDYRKNIIRRGREDSLSIIGGLNDSNSENDDDDIETKGTIEMSNKLS